MPSDTPESGPTPRELHIMFSNIIDSLNDVKVQMATKEFVNTKFDYFSERATRTEQDVKEWIRTSTAAHVKLEADRIAGDKDLEVSIKDSVKVVSDRLTELETELKEQEKTLKAQRNGRAQAITIAILGSILSVVGSIIASGVIRGLFPVS
jgi:ABC-type Na+ efflux pump permease subunit